MATTLDVIVITTIVLFCLYVIVTSVEKRLIEENQALRSVIECKDQQTETLYKILKQIHSDLSLLKLKDCPEEEFKNIPFEIIHWIEELMKIKEETSCQDLEKDL